MLPQTLAAPAYALLMICAMAAALEQLAGEDRGASAFRLLCALTVAAGALRLAARLIG